MPRIYLYSGNGTSNNGTNCDVTFRNLRLPVPKVDPSDGWFLRVESFYLNDAGASDINAGPFLVLSSLPNIDGCSSLTNSRLMPLILTTYDVSFGAGTKHDVGIRLPGSLQNLFQGNELRIQIAGLDGTVYAGRTSVTWGLILSIYHNDT